MWKYINERFKHHIQEATDRYNVDLDPKVQGPATRMVIRGNNSDIHQVMERLQDKVKQLEPRMRSVTVYPGMERKSVEELQPLFERVVLTDGYGSGIALFGLREDVEDAKHKLQDILTKDRKRGIVQGEGVDQPAPDMTSSRPIPISMATKPSGTVQPNDCGPMSPTRTSSYQAAVSSPMSSTSDSVSAQTPSTSAYGSRTTASDTMSQPSTVMGQIKNPGTTSTPTGTVSEAPSPVPPRSPQDSTSKYEPDFSKMKTPPITLQSIMSKLQIHILEYNITEMKVDAVVTSASELLEHRYGAAKAIMQAAGEQIQKECQNMISERNNVPFTKGTVYVSQPGKLSCKDLMHAIVPWKRGRHQEDIKMVANALKECFKEANMKRYKTIAFPALNSGMLGKDVATEAITTAIKMYMTQVKTNNLEHMYLVDVNPDMVGNLQSKVGTMNFFSKVTFKGTEAAQLRFEHFTRSVPESTSEPRAVGVGSSQVLPLKSSGTVAGKTQGDASTTTAAASDESCPICMEAITQPKVLPCKHMFCTDCIEQAFSKTKPACPICGTIFGTLKGNQPRGVMNTRTEYSSRLSGFPHNGVIVIDYHIYDGCQTEEHPNPRQRFKGLRRTAYLPDNSEGRKVERLLRKAFDARLIFTIGRSVTTGRENCVTWNDIHHKTNREGGPAKFGYPDPGYLQRVQEELAAKGIKE